MPYDHKVIFVGMSEWILRAERKEESLGTQIEIRNGLEGTDLGAAEAVPKEEMLPTVIVQAPNF